MAEVVGWPKLSFDVSRETIEALEFYETELVKWNRNINLVSGSTISDLRDRHIVDCLQLCPLIGASAKGLVDLGSGAGLPGIVLAIFAAGHKSDLEVTLIEADKRKAAFLISIRSALMLNVKVVSERIEDVDLVEPDVITARALASLGDLFSLSFRFCKPQTTLLFLKGKAHKQEIKLAKELWSFECKEIPSMTSEDSVILKVNNLSSKNKVIR